jgi:geranylgeranyl diphosphate synthase type I
MKAGIEAILAHKPVIDTFLTAYFSSKNAILSKVDEKCAKTATDKLLRFATTGKSIRGSLACYTYTLFRESLSDVAVTGAAALELFHSGFLIHDDIFDRDDLRHGAPTIHRQYEKVTRGTSAAHIGISQAINVGDLAFFCGAELLTGLNHPVAGRVMGELSAVIIAQMLDVGASSSDRTLSGDQILSLYRYKTARYTFSLPFLLGATLADAPKTTVGNLMMLGEHMGILYQLRDDELNLSGNTKVTGKSAGSDIRDGKQTYRAWLSSEGIPSDEVIGTHMNASRALISDLPFSATVKETLSDTLRFCGERNK